MCLAIAAYDVDGTLCRAKKSDVTLTTNENNLTSSFDCKGLPDEFTLKAFVWDSGMVPLGNAVVNDIKISDL